VGYFSSEREHCERVENTEDRRWSLEY